MKFALLLAQIAFACSAFADRSMVYNGKTVYCPDNTTFVFDNDVLTCKARAGQRSSDDSMAEFDQDMEDMKRDMEKMKREINEMAAQARKRSKQDRQKYNCPDGTLIVINGNATCDGEAAGTVQ